MTPSIRTIERRFERGDLEVENLLALLKRPDPNVGAELAATSEKFGWPSLQEAESRSTSNCRVLPYGAWAEVVVEFSKGKFRALGELLKRSSTSSFVVAACETIRTSESLEFLLASHADLIANPIANIKASALLASAMNSLLSFKPRVTPSAEQEVTIRRFLEKLALGSSKPEIRGIAYCALRQVGDSGSIGLIESLPALTGSWAGAQTAAKRAILRRLRDEA